MTFPANFPVGWHQYVEGATDSHGNPVTEYVPPLDEAGAVLKVIDIAPVRSTEPNETRNVDRRKVHAPADCPVKAQDVIDLPEGQFEVDGDIEDQTRGFHGWRPGVVVWLKRTTR